MMSQAEESPETLGGERAGRIPELDGLRGIAILSVMVWHYFYFHPASDHHPVGWAREAYVHFERFLGLGWSGVDLFFVLSGFLIGGILLNARSSPNYFSTFYLRRFFRIVPIYYFCVAVYLVVWGLFFVYERSSWVIGSPGAWKGILGHFLFLQNLGIFENSGLARIWLTPTWSLAVEEQFYLIAPFVVRKFDERFLLRFLAVVAVLAPLLRLGIRHYYGLPRGAYAAYILMPCRADSLAVGMLIALLWRRQAWQEWVKLNSRAIGLLVGVLFAGAIFLTFDYPDRYLPLTQILGHSWLALLFGGVLVLALACPNTKLASYLRTEALRKWGRISYCVYLIHQTIHFLIRSILGASETVSDWRLLVAPALAIPVTYFIASLSWRFFEEKMLRIGQQFRY